MNISRGHVKQLAIMISELSREKNRDLAYGLSKNKTRMSEELSAIGEYEKSLEPYENERVEICEKYSEKDANGNSVMIGNSYKVDHNDISFRESMISLQQKYRDVLIAADNFLRGAVEINFYKMPLSVFPEYLSSDDIDVLMPLIED